MSYVLIMILTAHAYNAVAVTTVREEFTSLAACEVARAEIAKAHKPGYLHLRSQGCYKR